MISDSEIITANNAEQDFSSGIIEIATQPLSSMTKFKEEIIRCFNVFLDGHGYIFYDFKAQHGIYLDSAPYSVNLNSSYTDSNWMKNLQKTCIYQIEKDPQFRRPGKYIYEIEDVSSLTDYEKNPNYLALVRDSPYYHSLVVVFKRSTELLGQITIMRPKELGKFTSEDKKALNRVIPIINNRMMDYKSIMVMQVYDELLSEILSSEKGGIILLDDKGHWLRANALAREFCCDLVENFNPELGYYGQIVNSITFNLNCDNNTFVLTSKNGHEYRFDIKTIGTFPEFGFSKAILVCVTYGRRFIDNIEIPPTVFANRELSKREKQVISLMAKGMPNSEIAEILGLSSNTTRTHIQNIRKKLGVNNKLAMMKALDLFND